MLWSGSRQVSAIAPLGVQSRIAVIHLVLSTRGRLFQCLGALAREALLARPLTPQPLLFELQSVRGLLLGCSGQSAYRLNRLRRIDLRRGRREEMV